MTKAEMNLLYMAFAGFSLGIMLQQTFFILHMLVQIALALFVGNRLGRLYGDGRQWGFIFFAVLLATSAIAAVRFEAEEPARIHWAFTAFWAMSSVLVVRVDWVKLHRFVLAVSVPGMLYSIYWLIQPDEFKWALEVGFGMYPRASGFLSNAITNSEGLVVIAAWTISRLQTDLSKRERNLLFVHLAVSVLIVLFSRVRSGVVGFFVLFAMLALASPRYRKLALRALVAIGIVFGLTIAIFGFNTASIERRLLLMERAVALIELSPVVGIGPSRFKEMELANLDAPLSHPHNTLLGITAESGFLGLAAYLAFMGSLAWQLLALWRTHVREQTPLAWVVRALTFAFVLYWLFGLFDYNFADTELVILHGFQWSMIAALWTTTVDRAQPAPAD